MKNYSIYYSYKNLGDILLIVFNDEKDTTNIENKGRVVVIKNGEEIIGYNILNVKDIIKIKSDGLIYFPTPELIQVINNILANEKLPTLDYMTESGYYVTEITEINKGVATLSLGDIDFHALSNPLLKQGDKVVAVKAGKRLRDGKIIHTCTENGIKIDAYICTNSDLSIEENDEPFIIDEDIENGKDFFMLEEM